MEPSWDLLVVFTFGYGRFLFVLCTAGQADLRVNCDSARHVALTGWCDLGPLWASGVVRMGPDRPCDSFGPIFKPNARFSTNLGPILMFWGWTRTLVSHDLDLAWPDLAKISMLRLSIGSGMLRLSSCMLRLSLTYTTRIC